MPRQRSFPDILEDLIEEAGLTKKELVPIFGSSIYKYCKKEGKDKREPNIDTLNRLADYFKVSTDYLLGRTSEKRRTVDGGYVYYMNELIDRFPDEIKDFILSEQTAPYITFAKEMAEADIDTEVLKPIIDTIKHAKNALNPDTSENK